MLARVSKRSRAPASAKAQRRPAARPSQPSAQRGYATQSAAAEVKVEFTPFKTHRIDPPKNTTTTNREELLGYFKEMTLMRRMEVAADTMYKQKLVRGFLHLYNGQEAVASGLESTLTKEDSVIGAYRTHIFMISRRAGGNVREVMAELAGKTTGCSKGYGGSMHMYKADANFYGGNGIVGAQIPIGAGLAFAHKYKKDGRVSFTYFGDGAANQGQVYEAFNMAALWKLPAVFVVENNQYGMGTSVERASATKEFYTRGDYIPGIQVDGMDVLAVKECGKFAVAYAKTHGPILVEAKTYRYQGHSMSDPGTTYRTRDEVQKMRESRDPIELVRGRLLRFNFATEDVLKKIEMEVKEVVDDAVEFAKASPEPSARDLWQNVFTEDVSVRGTEINNGYTASQ